MLSLYANLYCYPSDIQLSKIELLLYLGTTPPERLAPLRESSLKRPIGRRRSTRRAPEEETRFHNLEWRTPRRPAGQCGRDLQYISEIITGVECNGCHLLRQLAPASVTAPTFSLRKEVIQPQVLLRLPCYDFTPIMSHTLGRSSPCGSGRRLLVQPTFVM